MPYLAIEDFRAGVDRRRSRSLGKPGQLWTLTNAHINAGGEIERRKKWVKSFDLPPDCFGLAWARGRLWTFGSREAPKPVPAGLSYRQLRHPKEKNMVRLVDFELFNGKFYCIADYDNGDTLHFFDGKIVKALLEGEGQFAPSLGGVAQKLAAAIAEDGWLTHADRDAKGPLVLIEGAIGQNFEVSADVTMGSARRTSFVEVELLQDALPPLDAIAASARFTVLAGNPDAVLSDLLVDGQSLIRAAVKGHRDPNEWAAAIAGAIQAGGSRFRAAREGATILLTAPLSLGAGLNGRAPSLLQTGDGIGAVTRFGGGKTGYGGAAKRFAVHLLGDFNVEDGWRIQVNGQSYGYVSGRGGLGRAAKTDGDKMYLATGSILSFSKIADPATFYPHEHGAGFINFSSHFGGSEDIAGIEGFGRNLAVFSAAAVQLWRTDPDPARMARLQTLPNTGALAAGTLVSYGDSDLFYLARQGIRSLRPRGDTELGEVGDIGAPIDPLVTGWLATQHPAAIRRARSAIEPVSGRFWCAVGVRAFVFSYYRASKISAWSTYDLPFAVERFAVGARDFYALGSDRAVYLYGGPAGDEWDDGEIIVETPFLPLTAPATLKAIKGLDIVAPAGEWDWGLSLDPDRPEVEVLSGCGLTGTTYSAANIPLLGVSAHVALTLRCRSKGAARLAGVTLHFEKQESE